MTTAPLRIELWTESDWYRSRSAWSELQQRSGADPLFRSFDWLTLWWRHYGRGNGQLWLLAAYHGQKLVGLAPFMSTRVRRGPLWIRSLQMLGGALGPGDLNGTVTEYQDVIAETEHAGEFRRAAIEFLQRATSFSELGVAFSHRIDAWREAIRAACEPARTHLRATPQLMSYQAHLDGGFAAYLARLSGNARRKIFHQRKLLASHGAVRLETVQPRELGEAFQQLNHLHAKRWSKELYSPDTMQFYTDLVSEPQSGIRCAVSRLWVGGRLASILHDVAIGDREYNLQMGYDSTLDPRISLGTLHLGYAMEQAAGQGCLTYDFLAGRGRTTDYKERFAQTRQPVQTLWMMHGQMLPGAVAFYDRLIGRQPAPA